MQYSAMEFSDLLLAVASRSLLLLLLLADGAAQSLLQTNDGSQGALINAVLELAEELEVVGVLDDLLHGLGPVLVHGLEHAAHHGVHQGGGEGVALLGGDETQADESVDDGVELLLAHLVVVEVHAQSLR